LSNLRFPISIKHIYNFVSANQKHNLKINIVLLSEDCIYQLKYGIGDGKKITNTGHGIGKKFYLAPFGQ
jgi:hypothetical protein